MKNKLYKILRGTITSLLFLILSVFIGTEIIFTFMNMEGKTMSSLIDKEEILDEFQEQLPSVKEIAENYCEDYFNYIFHKRSYPSLQTVDYKSLEDDEKEEARLVVGKLQDKLNLSYEEVDTLRNANNFLGNHAINFLVIVGIFALFLIIVVVQRSFKKGAFLLAVCLVLSSLIILVGIRPLVGAMIKRASEPMANIIEAIFTPYFLNYATNIALTYFFLGLFISIVFIVVNRIIQKKR